MIIKGVDVSALPDQFGGCVPGTTLITDGDGPAYVAAATVKRLDTGIRRFQQAILAQMFMAKAQFVRIHLTASSSHKAGRFNMLGVKPYQGNRDNKSKPVLLEPLRQAMTNPENWLPEFYVEMHHVLEADDGMIMDAYRLKDQGIIRSDDKDLRMTPYPYYDIKAGSVRTGEPFGWLQPSCAPAGTVKLIGQGPLFFWAQMLMGDTADNVQGILRFDEKKCGPSGAYQALKDVKDIHEAANTVISGYRAIDQNPLPEGWMLWLLRWEGDTFWQYLQELNISDDNRRFLEDCAGRKWFDEGGEASSEPDGFVEG